MEMVIQTIYVSKADFDLFEEAKKVAQREGKKFSFVVKELLKAYIKSHGSGNPSYPLEKWVHDPKFKAFPTIGETPSADWVKKMDKQDLQQFIDNSGGWYRLAVMHRDRKL